MNFLMFYAVIALVILVHEAAHALAARAMGATVKGVSIFFGPEVMSVTDMRGCRWSLRLLPFGGFANIADFDLISPRKAFIIAAAGPAASIGVPCVILGFVSAYLVGPAKTAELMVLLAGQLLHMGWAAISSVFDLTIVTASQPMSANGKMTANVIADFGWAAMPVMAVVLSLGLGVFNLLPFPPLDGGRMLIAGIEGMSRRRLPAGAKVALMLPGVLLVLASVSVSVGREAFGIWSRVMAP